MNVSIKNDYKWGLLIAIPLFLLACQSGVEESSRNGNEPTETPVEHEPLTADSELMEVAAQPVDSWQITEYAAHLHGGPIVESADIAEMDEWYYLIKDEKGGFVSITGAVEGWKEYALWRMEDGKDLIGVMTVECGGACGYHFEFYKGSGEAITLCDPSSILPIADLEVQRQLLYPKVIEAYPVDYPDDSEIVYSFPQEGTSMDVDLIVGADEIRVKLAQLSWNKTKFFIEKTYEEVEIVGG